MRFRGTPYTVEEPVVISTHDDLPSSPWVDVTLNLCNEVLELSRTLRQGSPNNYIKDCYTSSSVNESSVETQSDTNNTSSTVSNAEEFPDESSVNNNDSPDRSGLSQRSNDGDDGNGRHHSLSSSDVEGNQFSWIIKE